MKIITTLIISYLTLIAAQAGPFLVSDPYPADDKQPVKFLIDGLPGGMIAVDAYAATDKTVSLHYDVANLAKGSYELTIVACGSSGQVSPPLHCTLKYDGTSVQIIPMPRP